MATKRLKGRPMRGGAEVGRERLLEAARAILRVRTPPDVSRKAVADNAGVSPALVTYYFPDKNSLLDAATKPLLVARQAQLRDVLDAPVPPRETLRAIIRLFLSLSHLERNVGALAVLQPAAEGHSGTIQAALATAHRQLLAFHARGAAMGEWRVKDGRVFVATLWGMCMGLLETGAGNVDDDATDAGVLEPLVDTVLDVALHGLVGPPRTGEAAAA